MVSLVRLAIAGLGSCFCIGVVACTHGTAPSTNEAGGSGNASAGTGGASSAGSAGSGGSAGGIDQVDASTSCSDLFTLARQQLDEAASCIVDAGPECTGLVDATCGCRVSVDSPTSDATQSYLNTLAVIQAKKCGGTCPPLFCEPPGPGTCVPQAGTTNGVCIHRP
jgi:hypothetical protein